MLVDGVEEGICLWGVVGGMILVDCLLISGDEVVLSFVIQEHGVRWNICSKRYICMRTKVA